MSEKDILYIIIPAYNEADNILNVINDWYPVVEKHNGNQKSRLVIIDDGSKDDTYNIISAAAETRPLLHPVKKNELRARWNCIIWISACNREQCRLCFSDRF